jgi:hypothetical protein
MKRPMIVAAIILVLAVGGVLAYRQFRGRPVQGQRADPAIAAASAIRVLERSEHPLTTEQVKTVLPMMKVLRDTDPNDVEASRALAEQIRAAFTREQHAELEQAREEALERRQSREGRGPGTDRQRGPRGFGPPGRGQAGPGGFNRAEFRERILSRLIQQLESRL